MVFSSPTFLFAFLPVTLLAYLASPVRWRNGCLLAASVVFYVWGSGGEVLALLYVGVVSFAGALLARRAAQRRQAAVERVLPVPVGAVPVGAVPVGSLGPGGPTDRDDTAGDDAPAPPDAGLVSSRGAVLVLIALLLVPLALFKYVPAVAALGGGQVNWALPLGISFFTFHAISYVVDVGRGTIAPERSLRDYLLYLFLFPHQIAGPIVRYAQIVTEVKDRRDVTLDNAAYGITRFCWGLAKKAVIADPAGQVADAAFASAGSDMSSATAWIGAAAYAVQIYFDFSGYSDMAIGLAAVFGFRFPENFASPYRSVGPADFWRRWHITLSQWFRDYVYIPLGGNRHGLRREYAGLLVTFALTALWHGAAWTFLVWGALHSLALLAERITGLRDVTGWIGLRRTVMAVFVIASWVPFRAETLGQAVDVWQAMFGLSTGPPAPEVLLALTPWTAVAASLGLLAFLGPRALTGFQIVHGRRSEFRFATAAVTAPVLFTVAVVSVFWLDFSPFLYFQF
jgi:alginate O-acetyltransferase complex protein AlgI